MSRLSNPSSQNDSRPLGGLFYALIGFFVLAYFMAIARHWVDAKQDAETQLRYFNGILVQNTRTTLKNFESVIAEGVENAETLALLESMGGEQAQGLPPQPSTPRGQAY